MTKYELTVSNVTDTQSEEDVKSGEIVCEYGVAAQDENGEEVFRMDNITPDKSSLNELVNICNRCDLSRLHIMDVIRDFVEMKS